jgi:iron complex outermembrane receptor protein
VHPTPALTALLGLAVAAAATPAAAQTVADLQAMSIGQLEDIEVTSVTKNHKSLSDAPGAIYVITQDAIRRSGAETLPEILRLAPNLEIDQISASRYIITARGFSGNIADQNFSNQLLVLIDGRSVYSPLYSGVYWDAQDVVPEDIERIEVISGPGATLWGANAVNGVINIITKKASETKGGLLDISAGNREQSASLQYSGQYDDALAYRFYVRDYLGADTENSTGSSAHDHWWKPQGGFRLDWTPAGSDSVTFQGDAYSGAENQPGIPDQDITGQNLVARWVHNWESGSSLQVQAYYDRTTRGTPGNGRFDLNVYDLDIQHSFGLGSWNQIVWGGEIRVSDYQIHGTASLYFVPPSRSLDLSDGFVQDSMSLSDSLTAILGFKLEDDPYSGATPLPGARLSWKVDDDTLLWTAVSRAIRSPTPFDDDVAERLGSAVALNGDQNFESATLVAYELGARKQITSELTLSVSGYYNDYDKLHSVEVVTGPATLNLTWGNNLQGYNYGFEAWADYQASDWWRLSASLNELCQHFNFTPDASAPFIGTSQLGDDPHTSATLRSSMNFGAGVEWEADFRYVSELPDPHVASYVELNSSIGWQMTDSVRLSLSGFNLLHDRHYEFPPSEASAVPRSYAVGFQWRF